MSKRILALEENEALIDQPNEAVIDGVDFGNEQVEVMEEVASISDITDSIEVAEAAVDTLGKYQTFLHPETEVPAELPPPVEGVVEEQGQVTEVPVETSPDNVVEIPPEGAVETPVDTTTPAPAEVTEPTVIVEDIPEDAAQVIQIAVESLRKQLAFKEPKISLESQSTRRASLEAEIKDTLNRAWEAIKSAFLRASIWVRDFLARMFDRNLRLEKYIDNLIAKVHIFDQWKVRQLKGSVPFSFSGNTGIYYGWKKTASQVVANIDKFTPYIHNVDKIVKSPNNKSDKILNQTITVSEDASGVVKYRITRGEARRHDDEMALDKLVLADLVSDLKLIRSTLVEFNSVYKANGDIVSGLNREINGLKEGSDLIVAKSKLHYYTSFIPELAKVVYSALRELTSVYATVINAIPASAKA